MTNVLIYRRIQLIALLGKGSIHEMVSQGTLFRQLVAPETASLIWKFWKFSESPEECECFLEAETCPQVSHATSLRSGRRRQGVLGLLWLFFARMS